MNYGLGYLTGTMVGYLLAEIAPDLYDAISL
jgi:hypothetical protein